MGIDKFTNLILTAKEDHRLDSPHHQRGGPKIHFDLAGYEILFWEADKLEDFRQELEKRIRRRKAILVPAGVQKPVWDTGWLAKHREKALAGLAELDFKAHMETRFALLGENLSKSPSELVGAAEQAQIHASGWPFAVVLTKAAYAPRPTAEGIIAEIRIPGEPSYDYWALRRSGDFFLLRSLSEDRQQPENIWFDTRITQVTEALLYCSRLYSRLGVPPDGRLAVAIKHSGLQGRFLGEWDRRRSLYERRRTVENEVEAEERFSLGEIDTRLIELVKRFTQPLYEVFDFFRLGDGIYQEIVDRFVNEVRAGRGT
jgi:hypothetical protein